jgi:hypothetical protein
VKTIEEKSTVKLFLFFLQSFLFGQIIFFLAHSPFGAWSFLLVHIQFTPSEGPKCFTNCLFKKLDHGSWTMKSNHEKRPSFVVRPHGPRCKPTLSRNPRVFQVQPVRCCVIFRFFLVNLRHIP